MWNKLIEARGALPLCNPEFALNGRTSCGALTMDRETQFATEMQALRVLCDEAVAREQRQRLLESLDQHTFIDPEHQVVFESIRALFQRGPISMAQLRVHLNNRGFPDTDVEKYVLAPHAGNIEFRPAGKIRP
jgi:hypothetical protein